MARSMRQLGFAACALASVSVIAQGLAPAAGNAADMGENPFAELTDAQWAAVADAWEDLSGAERRWFLTESRKRNAARRSETRLEVRLVYRERARFGRIASARTHIESTALGQGELRGQRGKQSDLADPRADRRYGLGFEERQRDMPGLSSSKRASPTGASAAETSVNWHGRPQAASFQRPAAQPEREPGTVP